MAGSPIILDSGILGQLAHPKRDDDLDRWLRLATLHRRALAVSEVADYEVRRELIRAGKLRSLRILDELGALLTYLPITTPIMRRAAKMWADVRRAGLPTAAPGDIDWDVILAAQAIEVGLAGASPIVATTNVRHLGRFVDARRWRDIPV
jgi:predicted nucleic acid-binding protein